MFLMYLRFIMQAESEPKAKLGEVNWNGLAEEALYELHVNFPQFAGMSAMEIWEKVNKK